MRLDSMDYFGCPACSGSLELSAKQMKDDTDILEGKLICQGCDESFDIKDSTADLTFPKKLGRMDQQSERLWERVADMHKKGKNYDRKWLFYLGIWSFVLRETSARRQLIDRLELGEKNSVLEVSAGTGANLDIIAKHVGIKFRLHGLDISSGMVTLARQKMSGKNIHVELVKGNASYLPYRSDRFDAVFHLGAINQFYAKRRAMEEMHRVAKKGAKIVICDEGLAPGREKTLLGKWILYKNPFMFQSKPPFKLVPKDVEDLKVYWVFQKTFWVIEYRKK